MGIVRCDTPPITTVPGRYVPEGIPTVRRPGRAGQSIGGVPPLQVRGTTGTLVPVTRFKSERIRYPLIVDGVRFQSRRR